MKPPPLAVVRTMLELQESMNRKIDSNWDSAGFAFLRAVLVESVEALDHYGWKWWKAHTPDLPQLRIELVDVWHFLLSHYLAAARSDREAAARAIVEDWSSAAAFTLDGRRYDPAALDLRERLELLAALSAIRRVHLPLVVSIFEACGMSAETLYRSYVSKNVLNHFRQDHGYKSGEYRKLWEGREDNAHMEELLDTLDPASESLPARLYEALEQRYRQLS